MEWNDDFNKIQEALYHDYHDNWSKAHEIVDNMSGRDAALIHAYLHRKEGDQWNAEYWYRRAGADVYKGNLKEEWEFLWNKFK